MPAWPYSRRDFSHHCTLTDNSLSWISPQTAAGLALPLEQPHENVGDLSWRQPEKSTKLLVCSWSFVKWRVWKAVGHTLPRECLGRKGLLERLHWEGVAVLALVVCDDLSCSASLIHATKHNCWRFLYCPSHPSLPLLSPAPHPSLEAAQNGSARALGKPCRGRMGIWIRSCRKPPGMAQKQCECPHQHCSSLLARRGGFAVEHLPNP